LKTYDLKIFWDLDVWRLGFSNLAHFALEFTGKRLIEPGPVLEGNAIEPHRDGHAADEGAVELADENHRNLRAISIPASRLFRTALAGAYA
jgi:hypothetical protein